MSLVGRPAGIAYCALSHLGQFIIGLLCGRDFAILATYSGKLNISAIPLCEKTTAH
jgi:hypothetical protein